jgi:TatD DNase family protein
MARKLLRNGEFSFGIGGVVTFKNSGMDRVVVDLPLELLLLETDSPYLTPVPHRGKRNEPAYVEFVCRKIAEIHRTTPERVDAVTTATAKEIFSL